MYSGGLDTLVRTVIDWCFIGCSGGISMCFRFLKSKCLNIKLKCCVGDPDRYWNIGRKRFVRYIFPVVVVVVLLE